MSKNKTIDYGSVQVVLSRAYPFGEKIDVNGKEVTELTLNELNGFDDETIERETTLNKKMIGYVQIAISAGILYKEALSLANKDSAKVMEALQGL
jgi:hypothetical protein